MACFPAAQYRCTRAITIGANPEKVWPCWSKSGAYAAAGTPTTFWITSLVPAFGVESFARPSWLLWRSPNRTWAWLLIPQGNERTRLVTPLRAPSLSGDARWR
jgi:hypothetical protein